MPRLAAAQAQEERERQRKAAGSVVTSEEYERNHTRQLTRDEAVRLVASALESRDIREAVAFIEAQGYRLPKPVTANPALYVLG